VASQNYIYNKNQLIRTNPTRVLRKINLKTLKVYKIIVQNLAAGCHDLSAEFTRHKHMVQTSSRTPKAHILHAIDTRYLQ